MQAWCRDLIALRRSLSSLNNGEPGNALATFDENQRWLTLTRGTVDIHCNFGDLEHRFPAPSGSRLLLASRSTIAIADSGIALPSDSVAIVETAGA